jgi:hypothetical protein
MTSDNYFAIFDPQRFSGSKICCMKWTSGMRPLALGKPSTQEPGINGQMN